MPRAATVGLLASSTLLGSFNRSLIRDVGRYAATQVRKKLFQGEKKGGLTRDERRSVQRSLNRSRRQEERRQTKRQRIQYVYPGALSAVKTVTDTANLFSINRFDLNSVNLTYIAQGTEINERERQIIRVREIHIDLYLDNEQVDELQFVRVMVISPKFFSGTMTDTDLSENLLKGPGVSRSQDVNQTALTNGVEWFSLPVNRDKYKVFMDEMIPLETDPASGIERMKARIYKRYKLTMNEDIAYDGTGPTDVQGGIYMVYWTGTPRATVSPASNQVAVSYTCRTIFNDIL